MNEGAHRLVRRPNAMVLDHHDSLAEQRPGECHRARSSRKHSCRTTCVKVYTAVT
ncbi:MAG TPA: hypothetical protein VGS97_00935 [Actinocrinis sp.]|nr:hypothetical protein [Actinocrinis sp.]HEV2342630.1 hypothetical protein [Actinocrinis sp.]